MRVKLRGYTLLACLAILSSCALIVVPYGPSGSGWPSQVFFERDYRFSSGGRIDLQVENIETEIKISGHKEEKVRLSASQSLPFYQRGMWVSGRQRLFPQIKVEPEEQVLRIRIIGRQTSPFPLKIELFVPQNIKLDSINLEAGEVTISDLYGSVRVNLDKGDLKINNFSGSLEAEIIKGDIEAEVIDLREGDEIKLQTNNGNITLFLEPETSARIEAEARNGRISSDLPGEKLTGNPLKATLIEGKALIILKTLKGDILIRSIK